MRFVCAAVCGLVLVAEASAIDDDMPSTALLEFLGQWKGEEVVLDPNYEQIQKDSERNVEYRRDEK